MSICRFILSRQGKVLPKYFPTVDTSNFNKYSIIRVQRFLYGTTSDRSQPFGLKLNSQNIVTSPFPNVYGHENMLLHEAIWQNMQLWSDKTAVVSIHFFSSFFFFKCRLEKSFLIDREPRGFRGFCFQRVRSITTC